MTRAKWRQRALWVFVAGAIACAPLQARAHHGHSTTRVTGAAVTQPSLSGDADQATFSGGLTYGVHRFNSPRNNATQYERMELGAITTHFVTPRLAVAFPSGTQITLALPFGVIHSAPAYEDDTQQTAGVGDLSASVRQRIVSADATAQLSLRAGVIAPTGRYETSSALSFVDVEAGGPGEIATATYDTRASISAGAWIPSLGLQLAVPFGEHWGLESDVDAAVPITDTPDGIRWGTDLAARIGVVAATEQDRLTFRVATTLHGHLKDQTIDPITLRDQYTGGRTTLAAEAAAEVRLNDTFRCAVSVRVPVWRRVQGVQLTETVAGTLGCTAIWPQ